MYRRLVSLKLFALCVVALALIGCPERENVPADYVGDWRNDDRETGGITRMIITREEDDRLQVHVYGACVPSDCDWGTEWTLWVQGVNGWGSWEVSTIYRFENDDVRIVMELDRQTRTLWVVIDWFFLSDQHFWTEETFHKYG
ncbi:MAG: hypothetical protein IT365_29245 [Candidatus Hydrogenedentes bacterium]|nr:hypothetical protein [Candidatus Hydrogenedentota bacterium]